VVVDPDDADGDEAESEAEERGPLVAEGAGKRFAAGEMRYSDFEDEQGDGDGEDAVAEGLEAYGVGVVRAVVFDLTSL